MNAYVNPQGHMMVALRLWDLLVSREASSTLRPMHTLCERKVHEVCCVCLLKPLHEGASAWEGASGLCTLCWPAASGCDMLLTVMEERSGQMEFRPPQIHHGKCSALSELQACMSFCSESS